MSNPRTWAGEPIGWRGRRFGLSPAGIGNAARPVLASRLEGGRLFVSEYQMFVAVAWENVHVSDWRADLEIAAIMPSCGESIWRELGGSAALVPCFLRVRQGTGGRGPVLGAVENTG